MFVEIPLFGAIVLGFLGLLFLKVGLRTNQQVRRFRRYGQRMKASVIEVEKSKFGNTNDVLFRPVFVLPFDIEGSTPRPSLTSSSGYNFETDSHHDVLVLDDVSEVLLADEAGGSITGPVFMAFGLFALLFGVQGLAGFFGLS